MYRVFTRTWWSFNPNWPNGLEPCPGRKRTLRKNVPTEKEAREIAQEYNRTHKPGKLSRKAEFEEQ